MVIKYKSHNHQRNYSYLESPRKKGKGIEDLQRPFGTDFKILRAFFSYNSRLQKPQEEYSILIQRTIQERGIERETYMHCEVRELRVMYLQQGFWRRRRSNKGLCFPVYQ